MASNPDKVRDAERSRAAILDAAERLFAEQGYDATSLTNVGAVAGVSRGTPGYFFRSKAELYQAELDYAVDDLTRQADDWREQGPEVRQAFAEGFDSGFNGS